MRMDAFKRCAALILSMMLFLAGVMPALAEQAQLKSRPLVLTLGADLNETQRADILSYFNITEPQVSVITVTHDEELAQLGHLFPAEVLGRRTLSCALIRLTDNSGIQVKAANMNYVTSNMIASTLCTSGVYNCEVLTAAPFEMSGTGALTGVMMAYEAGTGQTLDPVKKNLANEELLITGEIASSIGQDQATLVVNDIKIHIVRDAVTDPEKVDQVVDNVISTTDQAAAQAAQVRGAQAPNKISAEQTQKLYDFSRKYSQIGYNYANMQQTLERVTRNIANATGIQDPILDTFTTIDMGLTMDSILLNTQDSVWGDNAIINATDDEALKHSIRGIIGFVTEE